jgi:hypothetical protein
VGFIRGFLAGFQGAFLEAFSWSFSQGFLNISRRKNSTQNTPIAPETSLEIQPQSIHKRHKQLIKTKINRKSFPKKNKKNEEKSGKCA